MTDASGRVFLFMQGPHGPFFRRLARALRERGAGVHRIAFDRGDEAEWRRTGSLHRRSRDDSSAFTAWLDDLLVTHGITDIVLYDDSRPVHRVAIERARARRLTTHCLGRGYAGPGCVTYERLGIDGNSRLMEISLERMAAALGPGMSPADEAPKAGRDHWWQLWHDSLHHTRCLLSSWGGDFPAPRDLSLRRAGPGHSARSLGAPLRRLGMVVRQWLLLRSDRTFHLVLLQPADQSMRAQSGFRSTSEVVERVIDAFAEGGAPGDHLVFKALRSDGRERLGRTVGQLARDLGLCRRVIFIGGGGNLARLLDRARSVITDDTTAGLEALWRGLPVSALGRAIHARSALVSEQPLAAFFRQPRRPDLRACWLFRRFLAETSQVTGSFHAPGGLELLVDKLPEIMLDPIDPYDRVLARSAPTTVRQ